VRALVIGAADPVGNRLSARLIGRGDDVRVAVPVIAEENLRHADRLDVLCVGDAEEDAARVVTDAEIIYDLGERMTDPWAAFGAPWSLSLDRSSGLLDAALQTPSVRRFVFLSSVAVYRPVPRRSQWPIAEDHPLEAHGAPDLEEFGARKIAAERRLAATADARPDLEVTILRSSTVYGPDVQWAAELVDAATRTDAGEQTGPESSATPMQWTHVDDLADALILAVTSPAAGGRTYNVAGGELFTLGDVQRATQILDGGWPWPAVLGDLSDSLKYDIGRARAELGYAPRVGLADGIAQIASVRAGWR
jgi:nucleoside-diphosphate-sugar epimerase